MYEEPKMEKLTINLPPVDLGRIDLLVEAGVYPTRTEFIRAAVRKTLDSHEDFLSERIETLKIKPSEIEPKEEDKIRRFFGMGVMHLGKENFDEALSKNQKIIGSFIGMVVIDKRVSAQLIQKTVEKINVYGVLRASSEVREVLEKINKKQ